MSTYKPRAFILNGYMYHAGVSGKFAIYNVGEKAVLECVFAEDVKGVELLYGNQLMVTNTSHKAMLQMWVEESLHNKTYLCRGNGPDATHLVYFTFIVQGKVSELLTTYGSNYKCMEFTL